MLRQAARNRELCRLCHAVMNHFPGSKNRTLTANENDSPPIPLLHSRDIGPTKPYATKHVDLEDVTPILIGYFIEGLGLVNSDVIDEYVHVGKKLEQAFSLRSRGHVSGESLDFRLGSGLPNLLQGGINGLIRTSVHDHMSAFRRKLAGNRETDAFGGARNESCLTGKFQIHKEWMILDG